MILPGWPPTPSCPGCLTSPKAAVIAHKCEILGVDFTTPLTTCPYCEEPIKRTTTTQKDIAAVVKDKIAAVKGQRTSPAKMEDQQPLAPVKPAPIKSASDKPASASLTPSLAAAPKSEGDISRELKTVAQKPVAPPQLIKAPADHKPEARPAAQYTTVAGILLVALLVGTIWFLLRETKPNHFDYKAISLAKTLTGHSDEVTSVALSSDGRILASGSTDAKVLIWDALAGEMKKSLSGNDGGVNAVAFSPDGETLVSGGRNSKIKVWNARTGELKRELTGHEDTITSVAFSPDGKTLASGSADFKAILWDAQTGDIKFRLRGHKDQVNSIAFSPDSKFLATAGKDNTIILWDTQTGESKNTITRHTDEVTSVAFSPDGSILASGSADFSVMLWDIHIGNLKNTLKHRDQVRSLIFSPDGSVLVTGSKDHMMRIWNVQAGELERTLADSRGAINSLAFSRDGKILVSGSKDSAIRVWEAPNHSATEANVGDWRKRRDMTNIEALRGIPAVLTSVLNQQRNRLNANNRNSMR